MMMSCERLALPSTAPNEIKTAAAQKSETSKLLFIKQKFQLDILRIFIKCDVTNKRLMIYLYILVVSKYLLCYYLRFLIFKFTFIDRN